MEDRNLSIQANRKRSPITCTIFCAAPKTLPCRLRKKMILLDNKTKALNKTVTKAIIVIHGHQLMESTWLRKKMPTINQGAAAMKYRAMV